MQNEKSDLLDTMQEVWSTVYRRDGKRPAHQNEQTLLRHQDLGTDPQNLYLGQSVLRQLLCEIRSSLWFSILADKATDISHHEQRSLSICSVDDNFTIHEDVLDLIQLPDTKSMTIFGVIKDILIRCSLPFSQC